MKAFLSVALMFILVACASTQGTHSLPPKNPQSQTMSPPPESESGAYGIGDFDFSKAVSLMTSMPTPEQVEKQKSSSPMIVKGTVTEVCPKKGCWMKLKTSAGDLRVAFKDYGFFVPVELVGREVAMQGQFIVHTESVAEQKHLLQDARRSQEEIDAVKSDRKTLRFIATGVQDLTKVQSRK